jgi:hypothetical protein
LLLGKVDFHKIKGKEILRRSHNVINTTDNNARLIGSISISTETQEFIYLVFEISLAF